MKKILLVAAFLLAACRAYADPITLKGTVVFRDNAEPAKRVMVYLDGTSFYATTDDAGRYSITVPQRMNTPLVFSHVSGKPILIDKPFESLPDTVFMDFRVIELADVVVRPMPYDRVQLMRFFRQQFLGTYNGGSLCDIENPDDIQFSWDASKRILTVKCENPLRINNRHLGYTLIFDLHQFMSQLHENSLKGVTHTIFFGTCAFIDTSNGKSEFRRNRKETYRTSFRSLIKSILADEIKSSGFLVARNPLEIEKLSQTGWTVSDTLSMKKIVIGKPAVKTEVHKGINAMVYDNIKVQYKNQEQISSIFFLSDHYLVDSYGNVDNVPGILLIGNMSEYKVGSMLPMDYVPPK